MTKSLKGETLLIATHNNCKLDEFRQIFAPLGVSVTSAGERGLVEPAETESTFIGNARIKAKAAMEASGLITIADDSGLCVDALDGAPGDRRLEIGARRDGDGVVIDVDDAGPGCSEEIRGRLFEPFVTTKPDGMGLGLSLSRSLLRSQGGDLWAERSPLGGARFSLRLPEHPVPQTAL